MTERDNVRKKVDEVRSKKARDRARDRITLTDPVEVIAPPNPMRMEEEEK